MNYSEQKIIEAFKIYSMLASVGESDFIMQKRYYEDDEIRYLVDIFCEEVDALVLSDGEKLILVPKGLESPFHLSNEALRKEIFGQSATNKQLYTAYVSIIILIGSFYNSYQTTEKTLDFISISEWVAEVSEIMEELAQFDEEELQKLDRKYEYNWSAILNYWTDLDEVREDSEDIRALSRRNFLIRVANFLCKNGWLENLGADEYTLTEKMDTVILGYYMDYELNRGLVDFLYGIKEENDGKDLED